MDTHKIVPMKHLPLFFLPKHNAKHCNMDHAHIPLLLSPQRNVKRQKFGEMGSMWFLQVQVAHQEWQNQHQWWKIYACDYQNPLANSLAWVFQGLLSAAYSRAASHLWCKKVGDNDINDAYGAPPSPANITSYCTLSLSLSLWKTLDLGVMGGEYLAPPPKKVG